MEEGREGGGERTKDTGAMRCRELGWTQRSSQTLVGTTRPHSRMYPKVVP